MLVAVPMTVVAVPHVSPPPPAVPARLCSGSLPACDQLLLDRTAQLIQVISRKALHFFECLLPDVMTQIEDIWTEAQQRARGGVLTDRDTESLGNQAANLLTRLVTPLERLKETFQKRGLQEEGIAVRALIHRLHNKHALFCGIVETLALVPQGESSEIEGVLARFSWERLRNFLPSDASAFLDLIFPPGIVRDRGPSVYRDLAQSIFSNAMQNRPSGKLPDSVSLKIDIDISPSKPIPPAIHRSMCTLLEQLVPNAVEALVADRPGLIEIHIVERSGTVTVAVRDNGCGIDSSIKDSLGTFGVSTKGPAGRRGHGMAIVRDIVKALDASFICDSTPHKGTRMEIRIPLHARAMSPHAKLSPRPGLQPSVAQPQIPETLLQ